MLENVTFYIFQMDLCWRHFVGEAVFAKLFFFSSNSPGRPQRVDCNRCNWDHHDAGVEAAPGQTGLLPTGLQVSWWSGGWRHRPRWLWVPHPEGPEPWHDVHHQHHRRKGPQEQRTCNHLSSHRSAPPTAFSPKTYSYTVSMYYLFRKVMFQMLKWIYGFIFKLVLIFRPCFTSPFVRHFQGRDGHRVFPIGLGTCYWCSWLVPPTPALDSAWVGNVLISCFHVSYLDNVC